MIVENLLRIIELLQGVDESSFDMEHFFDDRNEDKDYAIKRIVENNYSCGTAGCVIGHAVVLDTDLFDRIYVERRPLSVSATYAVWSSEFTGISFLSEEWEWCFGSDWCRVDNTINGAISRMEALIAGNHKQHKDYERFLDYVYQY